MSKSSVSLWVRDVPFTPSKRRMGPRLRPHPQQVAKLNEIQDLNAAGRERIGTLNDDAFLAAGAALYAGEGAKRDGCVTFANSDPAMIRFYCIWLRRFFEVAVRGRPGPAALRSLLVDRDPSLAPAESDLETLLFKILREAGLPAPVRHHEVVVAGQTFFLDAAYPELMIFMEGDGFGVHSRRGSFERIQKLGQCCADVSFSWGIGTGASTCEGSTGRCERQRAAKLA